MLVQLTCRSFRNLEDTRWQPGPGCHLVLGPNGAGKTSLLEAIYLLATTRSFRTAQLADCRALGSSEFHLSGEVQTNRRALIEVGIGSSGRYRRLNGRSCSLVEHLRALPVVAWTSGDRELITGPPSARRRFLDQGIVASRPAALEQLTRFRRTLAQKRELLTRGDRGLRSWNQVLAAVAAQLMVERRDYVARLAASLRELVLANALDLPDLRLEYRPSIQVDEISEEEVRSALEAARRRELVETRPLIGPHRDELAIRWGGRPARRMSSAGEIKILGLLLSAARGKVLEEAGRSPVFLLDDVDSDLDANRLRSVWRAFRNGRQVFASSSREAVGELIPQASKWNLEGGRLGPRQSLENRV